MQFDQLRRRELVTLLGGAAVAWALAARAPEVSPGATVRMLPDSERATLP